MKPIDGKKWDLELSFNKHEMFGYVYLSNISLFKRLSIKSIEWYYNVAIKKVGAWGCWSCVILP